MESKPEKRWNIVKPPNDTLDEVIKGEAVGGMILLDLPDVPPLENPPEFLHRATLSVHSKKMRMDSSKLEGGCDANDEKYRELTRSVQENLQQKDWYLKLMESTIKIGIQACESEGDAEGQQFQRQLIVPEGNRIKVRIGRNEWMWFEVPSIYLPRTSDDIYLCMQEPAQLSKIASSYNAVYVKLNAKYLEKRPNGHSVEFLDMY